METVTEMVTEQPDKALPEELVEKIIAMLPFPSLFKARCLSKAWLSRFSPISSQDDEVKKRAAASFQKLVRERSKEWGSLFPVCFDKDFVCAYHQACQKWVKLPSLSFLPEVFFRTGLANLWMEGALLFCVDRERKILYVVNIFTRSWKELPTPLDLRPTTSGFSSISLMDTSSDTYKAIFLRGDDPVNMEEGMALIYESKSNQWSMEFDDDGPESHCYPAYLNGMLYMVSDYDSLHRLQAFNVGKGTFEKIQLSFNDAIEVSSCNVVVCNAQLWMIVIERNYRKTVHMLKVDLVARKLLEVGRGPPFTLNGRRNVRVDDNVAPFSEGSHILFPIDDAFDGQMVAYNVQTNDWSYVDFESSFTAAYNPMVDFEWFGCSLKPGLNPFVEV